MSTIHNIDSSSNDELSQSLDKNNNTTTKDQIVKPPLIQSETTTDTLLSEKQDDKPTENTTVTKILPKIPQKNRCQSCNMKLNLAQQMCGTCGCGGIFCSLHRYADGHECPINGRKTHLEQLAKLNPRVVKDKINRI